MGFQYGEINNKDLVGGRTAQGRDVEDTRHIVQKMVPQQIKNLLNRT